MGGERELIIDFDWERMIQSVFSEINNGRFCKSPVLRAVAAALASENMDWEKAQKLADTPAADTLEMVLRVAQFIPEIWEVMDSKRQKRLAHRAEAAATDQTRLEAAS